MRKQFFVLYAVLMAFLISIGSFPMIAGAEAVSAGMTGSAETVSAGMTDSAETAASSEQSWSFVLYNNNNGMPFSEANALAQTSDGFIYVGSYGGLLRFDGESFYRFEDSRLINVITLYVDSRDRLWVGTNSNGFSVMENGEFTFYEGELRPFEDPLLEGCNIENLLSDDQGTIYGRVQNSTIFKVEDLKVVSRIEQDSITRDIVTTIYPDPKQKDYMYFGLDVGGILYGNPWTHKGGLQYYETPDLSMVTDILASDGRLWIATDKGIAFYDKNGKYVRPDKMQRSNAAQALMADLEGNIWAASYRLGVIKMSPSIFTNINSMANLSPLVVNATHIKDGILYIGADTGLICLDEDYNEVQVPVSELLSKERIRCIMEDRKGSLWFCTFGEHGLVCMDEDGTCTEFTKDSGFKSNYVRDILEMDDGTLAVSVRGGVYFFRDKEIVSFLEEENLPNQEVLSMYEDQPGRLLIGTNGNGIHYIENGEVHLLPGTEQLTSSTILQIRNKPGTDALWILSGTALYIWDDGQLSEVPDIPNLHNYDIVFDDNDNAWILAADGIYIGNADEILAGNPIRYMHYDYRSGLPFVVTPHCRNYLSDDGLLYMSGNDGVVRININQAAGVHSDVQLVVPYIETDDDTIYLTPGEEVVLPSSVKRLWIHPFALTYSLNEPVLEYQLEGFDKQMSVANRSDLPAFIYTNLKGGNYTFRFAVIDPSTGEVKKEIAIPIVKRKAYYEQALFWIFCAAVAAGIINAIVNIYLRKKTRELEEKHEQARLRTELSVARDIQASALPRVFPAFPGRKEIDLYASMDPATEVAGDFYDFFLMDKDHLVLVIADVSGKGVGASLFMMISKNTIKNSALSGHFSGPGEILTDVNNKLCEDNEANMFVTVWLGILTLSTGQIVTANGGHEYPVIFRKSSGFTLEKDKHGPALGMIEGIQYKESTWTLAPGDGMFVYTDGVPEATNAHNELFGTDRMVQALNKYTDKNPEGVLQGVRKEVDHFVGDAPQFDDLTMLEIKYFGS